MDKVDITIIGAGVVGLAIAAELADKNKQIVVLEKNSSFGQETSSRNSEVIHSGIHYKHGSLKAKLCVRGNNLLYKICRENNIGFKKIGKLTIASNEEELIEIKKLKKQGELNNVLELKLLDSKQVKEMEPNIDVLGALYSPSTGIIDSHGLMTHYLKTIEHNAGMVVYESEVIGIKRVSGFYEITVKKDNYTFGSNIVINCAGLHSDYIASLLNIDIEKEHYKLRFCKGEYFALRKRLDISRLIYSVPRGELGLGIHLAINLAGDQRLGPNAFYVNNIDYKVDPNHISEFYESAQRYFNNLTLEDLHPDTSGIRPKLKYETNNYRDFIIKNEKDKGLPNFINLIGIESPGLTSCPAIAEYVKNIITN